MFDDGFDDSGGGNSSSSRKDDKGLSDSSRAGTGTGSKIAIVTAVDKEEEWSEGGSGRQRPLSANSHHSRPVSPSLSPGPGGGPQGSERETRSGGKSKNVLTKIGSPSKGKGKHSKGGPGTPARYVRSPRSRARSFR